MIQKKTPNLLGVNVLIDYQLFCREEGIRTLDTVTRILPFQGSSFNHSDTSLFRDCKSNVFS